MNMKGKAGGKARQGGWGRVKVKKEKHEKVVVNEGKEQDVVNEGAG